jgi:AraC-like DNA-binding protein
MLIENQKSIQEIGYETGFNNLSHFNRTFKKVTHKTPSRYLNSL